MRQERIIRAREGKLQYLHSGQVEPVPQPDHIRRDDTQVFGQDGQAAQFGLDRLEKVRPRAFNPAPDLGSRVPGRDLPVSGKAPEMVYAQDIHQFQGGLHAFQPPGIPAGPVDFPLVQRIAPQLAGRGEIIRRHARHDGWLAVFIQVEQVGMRPHIRRIIGHEDRDIADDLHALFMCIGVQRIPLAEEQELDRMKIAEWLRPGLRVLP